MNVWNTNESCTMNVGMVLAYLTNYLTKQEVSSDDVKQALRNAEHHFKDTPNLDIIKLIKRALRCCVAGRTFGTQVAWWQILQFPIVDCNVKMHTLGLAESQSKVLRIPTGDAEEQGGHQIEKPDW